MAGPVAAGPLEFYGNLATRRVDFPDAGDYLPAHAHFYDHVTFVVQGTIAFDQGTGPPRIVDAPGWIEVPADASHQQTALRAPSVSYCVFAIRDEFGHVLQADEIEPTDRTQEARSAS